MAHRAQVIVLGNEKGGSGKSTAAVHLIVGLLHEGWTVAAIDLDHRQRSLARYLDNRRTHAARHRRNLAMPDYAVIGSTDASTRDAAWADERDRFTVRLDVYVAGHDFVVIDCPGSDSFLSRLAHARADIIVTPLNDSFLDIDVLAEVDPRTFKVIRPSRYSVMVWEQRKERLARDQVSIDWVVMRNRLATLDAHNKRRVGQVLAELGPRIGFRTAAGFGERVVYREMFLSGLTILDLGATKNEALTLSHVAARQEVRQLMLALGLGGAAAPGDTLPPPALAPGPPGATARAKAS